MRQCVKHFETQPQGGAIINIINHLAYTSAIARNSSFGHAKPLTTTVPLITTVCYQKVNK